MGKNSKQGKSNKVADNTTAAASIRGMSPGEFASHLAGEMDAYARLTTGALRETAAELRHHQKLLVDLMEELAPGSTMGNSPEDFQAPGHDHDTPGIWDEDNGADLAGTACVKCATWKRSVLEARRARILLGLPESTPESDLE